MGTAMARRPSAPHLFDEDLKLGGSTARKGEVGAGGSQGEGHGAAKAASGAGHDGDSASEVEELGAAQLGAVAVRAHS